MSLSPFPHEGTFWRLRVLPLGRGALTLTQISPKRPSPRETGEQKKVPGPLLVIRRSFRPIFPHDNPGNPPHWKPFRASKSLLRFPIEEYYMCESRTFFFLFSLWSSDTPLGFIPGTLPRLPTEDPIYLFPYFVWAVTRPPPKTCCSYEYPTLPQLSKELWQLILGNLLHLTLKIDSGYIRNCCV